MESLVCEEPSVKTLDPCSRRYERAVRQRSWGQLRLEKRAERRAEISEMRWRGEGERRLREGGLRHT